MNSAVLGSDAHLKLLNAEKLDKIGEDAEVRVGHQFPHERRDRRRGHQRQKKKDRDDVVDPGLLLQKHSDDEAEHELDTDRQHGVFERHLNGVPKFAIVQKVDVVLKPDEAPHHRQVQTVTLKRIIDSSDKRNQDAHADQQGRQAQQVRQIVYSSAGRRSVGALDCGLGHKANLRCDPSSLGEMG